MFILNSTLKTLILCKIGEHLEKLNTISYCGNILFYDTYSHSFNVINSFPVALFDIVKIVDKYKISVAARVIQNTNRNDIYKIVLSIKDNKVINYIDQNQRLISKEWFDIGYNFDKYGFAIVGKNINGQGYYSILKTDGTFLGPTNLLNVSLSGSQFGIITIQLGDGYFNYINMKTGKLLIPEHLKISFAEEFYEEQGIVLAYVEQKGNKSGYIDLNGKFWNTIENAKAGI